MLRPIAHVAIRDERRRAAIAGSLRREGWQVLESPTGFHLLEHLSPAILGEAATPMPALLVVDAISPGCSGLTIAAGLREMGHSMPVVLVASEDRPVTGRLPAEVVVTDASSAGEVAVQAARRLSRADPEPAPPGLLERGPLSMEL